MGRQQREAKLEALYGGPMGLAKVTERGGRKRDSKKALKKRMGELMASAPNPSTNVHQVSDAPTVLGSYQTGSLAGLIEGALTAPDTGPKTPDLRKYGPAAASTFPLTAGSLAAAKLRGLPVRETPEGAYMIERDEPSQDNYGQALGEAIFYNPDLSPELEDDLYTHELGHVSQARDKGLAFPIANAWEQIRSLMANEDPQDSRYEASATAEGKAIRN